MPSVTLKIARASIEIISMAAHTLPLRAKIITLVIPKQLITGAASAECTETIICLTFLFWLSSTFMLGSQVCSNSLHNSRVVLGGMFSCELQFFCCRAVFACCYASRVSESAANRLLILLRGGCVAQKTLTDCFWCRLVVLWKEIAWRE